MVEARGNLARAAGLTMLAVWMLPLCWLGLSAFITTEAFVGSAPFALTVSNFRAALELKNWGGAWMSSAITATATTVAVIYLAIPCAYVIARWPSRSGSLLGALIGTRILPPASTIVVYLVLGSLLHLLDTWAILIATGIVLQLGWVTALLALTLSPHSSALEDWLVSQGAGRIRAAWFFVRERAWKQILALAVLCWLFQWGEFFYATALTGGGRSQTVAVIVAGFSTGQDIQWGPMFAACILAGAPVILAMVISAAFLPELVRRFDRGSHDGSPTRGCADA